MIESNRDRKHEEIEPWALVDIGRYKGKGRGANRNVEYCRL